MFTFFTPLFRQFSALNHSIRYFLIIFIMIVGALHLVNDSSFLIFNREFMDPSRLFIFSILSSILFFISIYFRQKKEKALLSQSVQGQHWKSLLKIGVWYKRRFSSPESKTLNMIPLKLSKLSSQKGAKDFIFRQTSWGNFKWQDWPSSELVSREISIESIRDWMDCRLTSRSSWRKVRFTKIMLGS